MHIRLRSLDRMQYIRCGVLLRYFQSVIFQSCKFQSCKFSYPVLPLKAARRGAIAYLKCFSVLKHQQPNFDGFVYIHYAAQPYLSSVGFRLHAQPLATKQKAKFTEGWWNRSYFNRFVYQSFTKFSDDVGDPSYFLMPFPDCLCLISFRG